MKITREEYVSCLTHRSPQRPYLVELFGPLVGLDREWRDQGATEEEISLEAFGFDWVPFHDLEVNTDLLGGYGEKVLEDNDEYRIERDNLGRTVKLIKRSATIPLPLNFPVKDMDSWLTIKPFYTFSEKRFSREWESQALKAFNRGEVIRAAIPGGFDLPRQLMGEETACLAFYDQPDLIHDILETVGETAFRVLERASRMVPIHLLKIHEDMAGKGGPLIGPAQIEEFLNPYYRRIWELLNSRGTLLFDQDSDGNMNPVIDSFLNCGVNMMHPLEPAAGMDMVQVKRKYGSRISFSGGIDKFALLNGKSAIRKELEYKMQPEMRRGGILFGLDHRIPNRVTIENYRYYVHTAREILGLPQEVEKGWGRMAD